MYTLEFDVAFVHVNKTSIFGIVIKETIITCTSLRAGRHGVMVTLSILVLLK